MESCLQQELKKNENSEITTASIAPITVEDACASSKVITRFLKEKWRYWSKRFQNQHFKPTTSVFSYSQS